LPSVTKLLRAALAESLSDTEVVLLLLVDVPDLLIGTTRKAADMQFAAFYSQPTDSLKGTGKLS
jgi:hypothetical protein